MVKFFFRREVLIDKFDVKVFCLRTGREKVIQVACKLNHTRKMVEGERFPGKSVKPVHLGPIGSNLQVI